MPTVILMKNLYRRATQELGTVIKRFTDELEEQMGVKLFILAGYRDAEGEVTRTKSVGPAPPTKSPLIL
jgi:hypothetical protein